MEKLTKWVVVSLRVGLGVLFIYAGIQKFISKERPPVDPTAEVPEHVIKIRSLIGGMKQTGYFWEMVGVAEIACGILLVSQVFGLLGAVMLVPITLNVFLFHLFLEPHDKGELLMTSLYLILNFLLIFYDYPKLKTAFLPGKLSKI
ncbi:DoxX family protein [Marinigracilibium pacificum]|uniref:DoxX family protein n=1 Tax=Marinigracilibium pacificum TaxID=2729599 RepID=A0A848J7L1_9BACT|nr:DoxX family protein [Marinigracilibium pacificum]NMM50389.1 DoxX family protein [Marinigracilibium pacificum]